MIAHADLLMPAWEWCDFGYYHVARFGHEQFTVSVSTLELHAFERTTLAQIIRARYDQAVQMREAWIQSWSEVPDADTWWHE
jgi:hypothetical protein